MQERDVLVDEGAPVIDVARLIALQQELVDVLPQVLVVEPAGQYDGREEGAVARAGDHAHLDSMVFGGLEDAYDHVGDLRDLAGKEELHRQGVEGL